MCGLECAIQHSYTVADKHKIKQAKIKRAEHRASIVASKTRGQWLKEVQTLYNAWIRLRDSGKPCISCGSFTGKQNAGHYRSVGSAPELRFDETGRNCSLQCEKCNSYLSGNLINYRINLIKRIGIDAVEWLESKHTAKHYTIEDLKVLKGKYAALVKEAKKAPSS